MTEIQEATKRCIMRSVTEHPCPYPATEPIMSQPGGAPMICAFHAASEPLIDEFEEMEVSLSLAQTYLKGARRHPAAVALVEALERLEADFSGRLARAEKVLQDLEAAEFKLMRS
jgi:hypothetical protein